MSETLFTQVQYTLDTVFGVKSCNATFSIGSGYAVWAKSRHRDPANRARRQGIGGTGG